MEIDAKENIVFKNFYFHNTDTLIGNHCVYIKNQSYGIEIDHCYLDDAYRAIAGTSNNYAPADGSLISNCYFGPALTKIGTGVRVIGVLNFIVKNVGDACGLQVEGSGGILNNLIVGGGNVLTGNGSVYIKNNTVYNCTGGAIFLHRPEAIANVFNNILVPQQGSNAILIYTAGGSVRNDYNCIWGADGNPLGTPFKTSKSGGVTPVLGDNSIEADPDFVNAAGGDFRPRNPQVLRGGEPDVAGNPTQMGVILQRYQFTQRARTTKIGRIGIIR